MNRRLKPRYVRITATGGLSYVATQVNNPWRETNRFAIEAEDTDGRRTFVTVSDQQIKYLVRTLIDRVKRNEQEKQ